MGVAFGMLMFFILVVLAFILGAGLVMSFITFIVRALFGSDDDDFDRRNRRY